MVEAVEARRILVVDDEPVVVRGCERILGRAGYEVESAASGQEGIRRAAKGTFDLVMADLKLPDLDGMELVRILRIERPEVAIVIITGYSSVRSAAEAVRLGVSDYIEKPFTPDQITDAIGRALAAPDDRERLRIEASLTREVLKRAAGDPVFGQHLLTNVGLVVSGSLEAGVQEICARYGNDRARMMDMVRDVQDRFGCVSGQAMELIAKEVSTHRVEVESVVSFYAFLSKELKGKVAIRLCHDVINEQAGGERVARALSDELGVGFGQTTPDGRILLEHTACIGMCDQAPAALIDDVVVTRLTSESARRMARDLKQHLDPRRLVKELGDGNNAHPLVHAMVKNNIRREGPVVFAELSPGDAIGVAIAIPPPRVVQDVKAAGLRGRGGAGFPTGTKWEFTRLASGEKKCVLCNADEGEPGTFKDRVILTQQADLMFEGMTIAGYAVEAEVGIVYLRGEYAYLRPYLESILARRRGEGLLGGGICNKKGFDFDIRIQMGAGAYVCGEETALISSCEGLRGDPKNRPPFPAQNGYMGLPTVVNNVETFCCVARILEKGPDWFAGIGSKDSTGTKLLSVSGDCERPGVYELPFGIRLREVLEMAGARDPAAVQVGGPSGRMVSPGGFDRIICYDDLATGGSIMVFDSSRDVLGIAAGFMEFFVEEGCGFCTPCRVGNALLKDRLSDIRAGKGAPEDLEYLKDLGETIKFASRCGLGQTSANPVLTTLRNFPSLYEALVREPRDGNRRTFDIRAALRDATTIAGRESVIFTE